MSAIIGIDLGTSTSEVAIFSDGDITVIPNHLGETITPSCVHIRKDGEIIVGKEAKELLLLEPESTFYEVKRMFGADWMLHAHGKSYRPEEIQSFIIAYLVRCATAYLGQKVTDAVITVPAYFTDKQRKQTVLAGELAGISVARIVNEPTAAALDYGLANLSDCKRLLVYDLGGGTLDVTVLELFEGVVDVRSTSGNNKLGGKDFDEAIAAFLTGDERPDLRSSARIKAEAEICKMALSTKDSYQVALPFLQTKKGKTFVVDRAISRESLESLIGGLIRGTQAQIDAALEDARMGKDDFDEVLLVGGSTKIPLVARFLAEVFGKPPKELVHPDLAVVRGAAAQSAIITGDLAGELAITDVCPFTLGTAKLDTMLDRDVYHPLIRRNTTIPVSKTDRFSTVEDNQTEVEVEAYQGEYSNPDNNELLGMVTLDGIPPAPAGAEPIDITFSYDVNGILHVSAKIVSSGKNVDVSISTTGVKAMEQANIDGWQDVPGAKKYRPAIRKAEKLANGSSAFKDGLLLLTSHLKEAIVLGEDCEEIYSELMNLLEALK